MAEAKVRSPRERYREQTRAEIKEAALRQLAEGGAEALALTRIAKEMGMSGPALYRYFASRDELLDALVRDAYDAAAAALTAAGEAAAGAAEQPRARLHALAEAYRGWAVAEPHRYLLVEGTPLAGYRAPEDTRERARAALGPFLAVFADGSPGPAVRALADEMRAWLRDDTVTRAWVEGALAGPDAASGTAADAAGELERAATALAGAVLAWTYLHGAVALEAVGQFAGMGHRTATLVSAQVELAADAFSLA